MPLPRYLLQLQAADDGPPPDAVRLRKLVKALGRYHGLEVLDFRELPADAPPAPSPTPARSPERMTTP